MHVNSSDWPLDINPDIFNATEPPTAARNEEEFQPNEEWIKGKLKETQKLRQVSWTDMKAKVISVLKHMKKEKINYWWKP